MLAAGATAGAPRARGKGIAGAEGLASHGSQDFTKHTRYRTVAFGNLGVLRSS